MGRRDTATRSRRQPIGDPLAVRFARLMRESYGADLYLFGSRARRTSRKDSDYDLVAVASAFSQRRHPKRAADRHEIWREAGGYGIGLDLHCYTPEEFAYELDSLGAIGQAHSRGELIKIETDVREAA